MNNSAKLLLCALIFSAAGCSRHTTPTSSDNNTETAQQQPIADGNNIEQDTIYTNQIVLDEIETQQQDTVAQDVIAIPQVEDEDYEPIVFSEEQSVSIALPEYRNANIDDISLLLTQMGDEDFHYPTDNSSYVTSPYGWRHRRMHAGVDLKVYKGDDIYAAFDGVVRIARYYGAYGYCVVIRHYNGLETLYAHSSKLLVKVNDEVKAGQVIALGGSTGRSTGSHLHFEVRVAGNYINPNLLIDTKNHCLQNKNLYITRRKNRIFASNNDSAEEREAEIIRELSIKYHIVRSGDVLSRIAINNHTSVATICRLNHISSRSTLRIGQRLIVRDGIRPKATQTAKATQATPQKTVASKATSAPKSTATSTYTVKRGDTLSAIAHRNGTSISEICSLNNISSHSTLHVGQRLTLNGDAQEASSSTYTVKSGDTLSAIAHRNNTTISKICQLNNISTRSTLRIGQKLTLSGNAKPASTIYVVKSGDTLSRIAARNNTSIKKICQLNNISTRSTLRIGQKLKLA